MEELRKKLEELILINGTEDEEVLKLSQQLDNYIVSYYIKNLYSNYNQNMKEQSNSGNTNPNNSKGTENQSGDKNSKKNIINKNLKENDGNLEFLMALRNFVHPDRIKFIDTIIEAYKRGELKDA
jgi:hypothetical protein